MLVFFRIFFLALTITGLINIINPEKFSKGQKKQPSRKDYLKATIVSSLICLFLFSLGGNETGNKQDENQVNEAYVQAITAQKDKNFNKAIELFENVDKSSPNYNDAQKRVNQIKALESFKSGKTKFLANNLTDAYFNLQDALKYDPSLKEAKEIIAKIEAIWEKEEKIAETDYEKEILQNTDTVSKGLINIGALFQNPKNNSKWEAQVLNWIDTTNNAVENIFNMNPPKKYADIHNVYLQGAREVSIGLKFLKMGMRESNYDYLATGVKHINLGGEAVKQAKIIFPKE